ncbi:deoxyribonuclease-1-like isoform X1 [Haliotis rufescens]|uniref:deoxyribonuclease-1-like isoform X1 n=2 Tax=Haliotis rufescens TaxID=6454 RepID=UPI00201EF4F6|nr:deoxyribonuclease-1-like isoform X1 [Haliotis rufescens]
MVELARNYLLVGLCALGLLHVTRGLRLGAFNLKIFGTSKASKPDVVETIAKIISRYDIILLMEIRDITGTAASVLQEKLQKHKDVTSVYGFEISDRLGRTKSKEEYVFIYRKDRGISVVDKYHYDDGDEATKEDTFEREPFIVRFNSNRTVVPDFSLVAIHTNPTKALGEIKSLLDVYHDVKQRWKTNDVIILGDLNADCTYVRKSHWPTIDIRNQPEFYWPIGDEVDTTVTDTDCAYDRFIIAGTRLRNSVLNNSVGIYNFQKQYKLSKEQALNVSDHFPIELELKEKLAVGEGANTTFNMAVVVLSTLFVAKMCLC